MKTWPERALATATILAAMGLVALPLWGVWGNPGWGDIGKGVLSIVLGWLLVTLAVAVFLPRPGGRDDSEGGS